MASSCRGTMFILMLAGLLLASGAWFPPPVRADTPAVPYQRLSAEEAISRFGLDRFLTPGFTLSDPPANPTLVLHPELLRPGVLVYDIDGNDYDDYFFTERTLVEPHGACRSVVVLNGPEGWRRVDYSEMGALGLLDIEMAYLDGTDRLYVVLHTAGGQTGTLEVFVFGSGEPQRLLLVDDVKPFQARLMAQDDGTIGIWVVYWGQKETESVFRWRGTGFEEEVREVRPIAW